jgi:hypothetical protein
MLIKAASFASWLTKHAALIKTLEIYNSKSGVVAAPEEVQRLQAAMQLVQAAFFDCMQLEATQSTASTATAATAVTAVSR